MSQVPSTLQATLSNTLTSRVTRTYWWNTRTLLPLPPAKVSFPRGCEVSQENLKTVQSTGNLSPPSGLIPRTPGSLISGFTASRKRLRERRKPLTRYSCDPSCVPASSPEWGAKKSPSARTVHRKSLGSSGLFLAAQQRVTWTDSPSRHLPSFLHPSASPGVCWTRWTRGRGCGMTHQLDPGNGRLLTSPRFWECTFYPLFPQWEPLSRGQPGDSNVAFRPPL